MMMFITVNGILIEQNILIDKTIELILCVYLCFVLFLGLIFNCLVKTQNKLQIYILK